jgi:hypothetical protein
MLEAASWVVKTWWLIYTGLLFAFGREKSFANTPGGVDVR